MYPAYFLTLILFAGLAIGILHKSFFVVMKSFFVHLFFAQTWVPLSWFEALNSPTWFLSAYFGLLMIFLVCCKSRLLGACFFFLSIVLSVVFSDSDWWFFFSPYMRFYDFIIAYLLGLNVGCNSKSFLSGNKAFLLWLIMFLSIILTVFCRIVYWEVLPVSIKYSFVYLPTSLIDVYVFYKTENVGLFLSKLLKNRAFQYIGSISMHVYIYHWFFARIVFYLFHSIPVYITFPIVVAFSIVMADFMKKYVETRIFKLLQWSK